jgi:uncharacterized protein (DUF2235 family)
MKRLVCSLDGTWNDEDNSSPPTNVAKLHHAILPADGKGVRQFVRYIAGIATTEGMLVPSLRGAVGLEVGDRIKLGYQFLRDTYEPGDEIYLFGFSRGAFEARSLASFVTLFGIAPKDVDFPIDEAWDLYRRSDHKRDIDTLARLSGACHYPVPIRCIGVWDTVGNIGNPLSDSGWFSRQASFHDTRLHDTIDVALHALAIDEQRAAFRPTLFTLPEGTSPAPHQHVEQTWFPGAHADVGGGWPETALSDIALLWMAERAASTTGLAINIAKLEGAANPDPLGLQHDSARGWSSLGSRIVPFLRLIAQNLAGIPAKRFRWFRTWRTGKLRGGLISLNETVHESAIARLGQTVQKASEKSVRDIIYRPQNLVAVAEHEADAAISAEDDSLAVSGSLASRHVDANS